MKKNKKLLTVLVLCWLTYVFAYLCRLNLSTVLDKAAVGLDVTVEYLGIASSLYFGTYAVGQLMNGIVGDRVSPHKFIVVALLMTGTINVVLGLQHSGILFLVLFLGFFAVISKDADPHLLGKYMCFVPLGIFALEIVLGIVVHLREKNKE